MKFKKVSSLFLAATLGATILTGCSSSMMIRVHQKIQMETQN